MLRKEINYNEQLTPLRHLHW